MKRAFVQPQLLLTGTLIGGAGLLGIAGGSGPSLIEIFLSPFFVFPLATVASIIGYIYLLPPFLSIFKNTFRDLADLIRPILPRRLRKLFEPVQRHPVETKEPRLARSWKRFWKDPASFRRGEKWTLRLVLALLPLNLIMAPFTSSLLPETSVIPRLNWAFLAIGIFALFANTFFRQSSTSPWVTKGSFSDWFERVRCIQSDLFSQMTELERTHPGEKVFVSQVKQNLANLEVEKLYPNRPFLNETQRRQLENRGLAMYYTHELIQILRDGLDLENQREELEKKREELVEETRRVCLQVAGETNWPEIRVGVEKLGLQLESIQQASIR
jgi:hypothetical protein